MWMAAYQILVAKAIEMNVPSPGVMTNERACQKLGETPWSEKT